ncbi:MAG: 1-deoxy-D-xylulose-5-phosphate synthase [Clostridia bacterium]|nr:1-deoxy-D-xylulose-5-phosphate synthase [Clostridia bacterium]
MEISLLSSISSPEDLKNIPQAELSALCKEIRETIIDTVSKNGGHLASNLGCVELTVALHRSFSSPSDNFIFDVSHQTYTHKLLTGRYSRFHTLRKEGGLSGFSNPDESEHDLFKTGHSSNSISLALGVAEAKRLSNDPSYTVAIIGDGSLSSGLAFEGLNNAGRTSANLIIVVNDNKMSISRNVGGIARHLAVMRSRPSYLKFKSRLENFLIRIPLIGKPLRNSVYRIKKFFKNAIYHSNMFEDIGFSYFGPVDGHDLTKLCDVFKSAQMVKNKPVLIHVITKKGKGYEKAETTPDFYHSVAPFSPEKGAQISEKTTFSDVFADELCVLSDQNKNICAITAAMGMGTSLECFRRRYLERFFDVGIAEEHAVTFAAGLAAKGVIPVFAVYSSFLQRAYDELIHDAALQKRPVIIGVDRAGLVGEDGETHHGVFDVSFLSSIPGIAVYSPACFSDVRIALRKAVADNSGITAIRYPRGVEDDVFSNYQSSSDDIDIIKPSEQCIATLITYGRITAEAIKAVRILEKEKIYVKIIKINKIVPLDTETIKNNCSGKVFFFEESISHGSISERFCAAFEGRVTAVTLKHGFVTHASVKSLLAANNLDAESMIAIIKKECNL